MKACLYSYIEPEPNVEDYSLIPPVGALAKVVERMRDVHLRIDQIDFEIRRLNSNAEVKRADHGRRKFSDEIIEEVRRATGSNFNIAHRFNMSLSYVWQIKQGLHRKQRDPISLSIARNITRIKIKRTLKFSDAVIEQVRQSEDIYSDIAKRYGMSAAYICRIKNGLRRKGSAMKQVLATFIILAVL